MCILLYVKLIWCSGVPQIYGQLGGTSAMGICAFFYMWHWFGVVVLQRFMVNWWGTSAMSICAFCYMWNLFGVVMFQRSMVDWGYGCHGYMCILLYVKPIWCSGLPQIYGLLGGTSAMGICAFFYMWNLFGVVVVQKSMVNWGSRSATSSANMSSNIRNVKLPFLTTRYQYWGVDLPAGLDLPPGLPKLSV